MAISIPGANNLFSLLQEAFRHQDKDRPRIRLTQDVHVLLNDFRLLAQDVSSRPTRIAEIIPTMPTVIGACDAAGPGMGGVFFATDAGGKDRAFLWRHRFPRKVTNAVVLFDNPTGGINNSDLELCGNVAHHAVVADTLDI